MSLLVVGQIATVSASFLFNDGDSLLVPMVVRSISLGERQDWAMSPVLFLPETAMYGVVSIFSSQLRTTLIISAIVNVLALYGTLRLVAGRRAPGRVPVVAAIGGLAMFAMLVLFEGTVTRNGFALATLLATTTYYSATLLATAAVVGLVRRALDGARWRAIAVGIAVIALASVLTNPLFVVWAVLPVVGVLILIAATRRQAKVPVLALGGALVAGAVVGYGGREIFAESIVAVGGNYVRFDLWRASLEHLGSMVSEAASSWNGMLWLAMVVGAVLAAAGTAFRAWRRADVGTAFVGAVAVASAIGTTVGIVLVGSDAQRYLQPWVFLPVMALVAEWSRHPLRPRGRPAVVVALVAVVIGALLSVPRLAAAGGAADPDLACVVDWVNQSGRTGGGQFWTVRAPMASIDSPEHLVQIDPQLRQYDWLVNRGEPRPTSISFLLQDAQSSPFDLPPGFATDQSRMISCGQYTILDFGERAIPLGAPHN